MRALKWLDDNLEICIMGVCLSTITLVIFIDIVGRVVFNCGLVFAQELSRYCELYIAFLGVSLGAQLSAHIKVDLLQVFVPKMKIPLEVLGDVILMAFCVFMAYAGIPKLNAVRNSAAVSAVLQVPMFYIYLGLESGFILGALRVAEKYIKLINAGKKVKIPHIPENLEHKEGDE